MKYKLFLLFIIQLWYQRFYGIGFQVEANISSIQHDNDHSDNVLIGIHYLDLIPSVIYSNKHFHYNLQKRKLKYCLLD